MTKQESKKNMCVCGIKLTHDGGVAVIKEDKLLFSVEMEKLLNNKRHSPIRKLSIIEDVLKENQLSLDSIDLFVIDGWNDFTGNDSSEYSYVDVDGVKLKVAKYSDKKDESQNVVRGDFKLSNYGITYLSHTHIYSHLMSAYCTSPFSLDNQSTYVMVWDAGIKNRMYYYDSKVNTFSFVGNVLKFGGDIYVRLACEFAPFKQKNGRINHSCAGTVMAFIALGKVREDILQRYRQLYDIMEEDNAHPDWNASVWFVNKVVDEFDGLYPAEDILATFHHFLQELMLTSLKKVVDEDHNKSSNLCIVGGCGLNIKWNSAIRESGLFSEVYVPPFSNDSGAAIGVACAGMRNLNPTFSHLNWNIYGGPNLGTAYTDEGWGMRKCSPLEVARILYSENEPVVLLNGRAEIGPRALGNRSILASPVSSDIKSKLNKIKYREPFRPVAAICLEERVKDYFCPSYSSKYMLYDAKLTDDAVELVAIRHLDGSTRLQSLEKNDNPLLYEIIKEYEKISGYPVLCNTSANYPGKGFFPDVLSAQEWGRCKYIYNGEFLFERKDERSDVYSCIFDIIKKFNSKVEINPKSSLVDDLGLSSLNLMEILCEVEDVYGINFDDEISQLDKMLQTVDSFCQTVISKRRAHVKNL